MPENSKKVCGIQENNQIVRPMQVADVEAVSVLEAAIFSQPWSQKGFLDALNMENTIFLVAEYAGKIAGYIGMYLSMDEGEITNVAVEPEARCMGIGNALLSQAKAIASTKGITRIVLEVRVSNANAIRLYERNGFKICGTRKGFYEFPKEDAYIMLYETEGIE